MELESTRIFIKVAQLKSFSKAAELLKLPKSTVSRTISSLEKESGTKLFLRTTRSIALTEAGRIFYESCVGAIQTLEEARKSLNNKDNIIAGVIRLTAPEDFGPKIISSVISNLINSYPNLLFDLHYTDEIVDLVKEGFDIAIRIGKLNPSRFKFKSLGEITLTPVASPDYLKQLPQIKHPQELSSYNCLMFNSHTSHPRWLLYSGDKNITVNIKPKIISNQMTNLVNLSVLGVGIALVPIFLCQEELNSGKLVKVLPEWKSECLPISLVSPLSFNSSNRLKTISEHLAKAIQISLNSSQYFS